MDHSQYLPGKAEKEKKQNQHDGESGKGHYIFVFRACCLEGKLTIPVPTKEIGLRECEEDEESIFWLLL
jgi:hypothetical protein